MEIVLKNMNHFKREKLFLKLKYKKLLVQEMNTVHGFDKPIWHFLTEYEFNNIFLNPVLIKSIQSHTHRQPLMLIF